MRATYDIRSWNVSEQRWQLEGTISSFSPDRAIERWREISPESPKRLKAILVEGSHATTPNLATKRPPAPITPLSNPQPRGHHKSKRTKYTPGERYDVLNPDTFGKRPARIIDLSKPSRRDIRFK